MSEPFFTPEDFKISCREPIGGGVMDLGSSDAESSADIANAKVAPLLAQLAALEPAYHHIGELNDKLRARNAFLEDVFEKQKDFIDKGIDRELENMRLRKALESK